MLSLLINPAGSHTTCGLLITPTAPLNRDNLQRKKFRYSRLIPKGWEIQRDPCATTFKVPLKTRAKTKVLIGIKFAVDRANVGASLHQITKTKAEHPINKFSLSVSVAQPQVNCNRRNTACEFLFIPVLVYSMKSALRNPCTSLRALLKFKARKATALLKCNAVVLTV